MKRQRGITLIALVITIIILLILAGVVLNLTIRKNGVLDEAEYAVEETNKQTATEKINLKITTAQMSKYAEEQRMITLKELSLALGNDNEIEYVTESSKIASTKYEVGDNPTSIYTKLNNYPYEFEINSSLQLASINGVKIATNNTENNDILWQGQSTEGAELQLSKDISNYRFIEIYFRCTEGFNCPILKFNTVDIINKGKVYIYACTGGWHYGSGYSYDVSTNKLKNIDNACSGGSTYRYLTTSYLEIYKIEGIK